PLPRSSPNRDLLAHSCHLRAGSRRRPPSWGGEARMGAKARKAALARLHHQPGSPPLLGVATGPYIREGLECPALETLFLAAPVGYKGSIVQWAGRILRVYPGKTTAEIHDYHDVRTPVLAASLARRAPGYTHLGTPIRGVPVPRHRRATDAADPSVSE